MASSKVQSPRDEATPAPLLTSPYGCVVALSIRFGAVVNLRMGVLNGISAKFLGSCGCPHMSRVNGADAKIVNYQAAVGSSVTV